MQDVRRTLSEFKIRASYGQLGNQNIGSNYPTIQQLDVSSISVNDVITPDRHADDAGQSRHYLGIDRNVRRVSTPRFSTS